MDINNEEEAAPLISRPGIPTAVQDKRSPREKQRAVYIILASTLFERIAFYTLASNLAFNLASAATAFCKLTLANSRSLVRAPTIANK